MNPGPGASPRTRLRPLPLRELLQLEEGRSWAVDQPIAGLETLTPVRGSVRAVHHGTALEVEGQAETIVTLCCDRCLQRYNHPLRCETRELLDLAAAQSTTAAAAGCATAGSAPAEPAVIDSFAALEERLDPRGSFDPERWLFEQLSLQLPLVNRCGADCPGPDQWSSEPAVADPRWAALARLREG